MVVSNDEEIGKKINSAVFPGLQGGPLMHVIAGKAVAFGEALQPSFKLYAQSVIDNAKALGETLVKGGLDLVSGGTDTHLMLVDLRPKKLTGKAAEIALGRAHITCNKNGVPVRSGEADDHLGHSPRLAGRHHARLRRHRIPSRWRADPRSARRTCRQRRRGQSVSSRRA